MIWLLPVALIAAVAASSRTEKAERARLEAEVNAEKARLEAEKRAREEAAAKAAANKQLGEQYLAMKPTVGLRNYGEFRDLNGEFGRHL